jgi:putative flippase GtrA
MLQRSRELLRFSLVGSIGFLIDASAMQVLASDAGISPLWARAVSFPLALSVTWALNRAWTFESGRYRPAGSQYRRYIGVQVIGFLINYASFAFLVLAGGIWGEWPLLALLVGALLSMLFTYIASRTFVFSAHEDA